MCDPNVTIIALLNGDDDLSSLVAKRIWSPRLPTPEEYRPDLIKVNPTDAGTPGNNPGISISIRGGPSPSLYIPIVEPSFQVTAWAITSKKARAVQIAIAAVLHDLQDQLVDTLDGTARVMSGVQEVYPQDVIDSDTGWNTCVSFYRLTMDLNFTRK